MIQGRGFDSGKFGFVKELPQTNGKRNQTQEYRHWVDLFQRCYNSNSQKTKPTYKGCTVSEKWWDFQDFAKWYAEHPDQGKGWHLDKDMAVVGNKEYGPDACVFIPRSLNNFWIGCNTRRGDCPIGVTYNKPYRKYNVQGVDEYGVKTLNIYLDDPYDCFLVFKQHKESVARKLAALWDGKIDPRVVENLRSFELEFK